MVLIIYHKINIIHLYHILCQMVVDALLLCFSEDCDINRQTQDYYMNSSLMVSKC